MINRKRGVVEIVFDGEKRPFRLGNNELAALEDLTDGVRYQETLGGVKKWGMKQLRAILFVGLAGGEGMPDLEVDDVGEMMRTDEIPGYYEAIAKSVAASHGYAKKEPEKPGEAPAKPSEPIGTTSAE